MTSKKKSKKEQSSTTKKTNDIKIEDKVININKPKPIRTLGIDLSIGKIKLCLLTLYPEERRILGGWSSLPVNFEQIEEHEYQFSKGFIISVEAFLAHHNATTNDINTVVFCNGGAYYMSKSFSDGMKQAGGVFLKILRKSIFKIQYSYPIILVSFEDFKKIYFQNPVFISNNTS